MATNRWSPQQHKCLNDGQKWPHSTSLKYSNNHWRPRMTAFGFHQFQIIHFILSDYIQLAKADVILNSVHRIGAWHPGNIYFWATFFHHWVWRNSVAVVRKYFLNNFLIRKFILKIFSGCQTQFCGFTRCYRNDRHKTAPSPDPLYATLGTQTSHELKKT